MGLGTFDHLQLLPRRYHPGFPPIRDTVINQKTNLSPSVYKQRSVVMEFCPLGAILFSPAHQCYLARKAKAVHQKGALASSAHQYCLSRKAKAVMHWHLDAAWCVILHLHVSIKSLGRCIKAPATGGLCLGLYPFPQLKMSFLFLSSSFYC